MLELQIDDTGDSELVISQVLDKLANATLRIDLALRAWALSKEVLEKWRTLKTL